MNMIASKYRINIRKDECVLCKRCVRECSFGAINFNSEKNTITLTHSKCVDCQRCAALCPREAIFITRNQNTYADNHLYTANTLNEIYRQSATGGVLLSSMGSGIGSVPIYFDHLLLNASQVTNPSIDPLREPMETITFLGRRPRHIERERMENLSITFLRI